MPSRSQRALVQDMLDHVAFAQSHVAGFDRFAFTADLKTQHAVARCIEIIGEAARQLEPETRAAAADLPWRDIIGLRTILAHNYGRVDPEMLWVLLETELPALQERLAAFVHELD